MTRETREAEILASQFRQMSIDQDEKEKFSSGARRAQFGSFPQMSQGNFAGFSVPPPQFGDLGQYVRQPIIGMEEQNSWISEEASYTANLYGSESLFAEGYSLKQQFYNYPANHMRLADISAVIRSGLGT